MYGRGLRRRLPSMLGGDQRRHAARLLADVLAARHAGAVLRRGDRDGREPRDRGPLRGARADAVVGRAATPASRPRESRAGRCSPTARSASRRSTSRASGASPGSLLNWMERLIRRRRECPELGWGDVGAARSRTTRRSSRTAPTGRARRSSPCTTSAGRATEARLALDAEGVLVDLFGHDEHALDGELALALEPYGQRWFRLRRPGQRVAP